MLLSSSPPMEYQPDNLLYTNLLMDLIAWDFAPMDQCGSPVNVGYTANTDTGVGPTTTMGDQTPAEVPCVSTCFICCYSLFPQQGQASMDVVR